MLIHQIININKVSRTLWRKDWWLEKMITIDAQRCYSSLKLRTQLGIHIFNNKTQTQLNEMLQNKSLYYDNPIEINVCLALKVGWPFTWAKPQITVTTSSDKCLLAS